MTETDKAYIAGLIDGEGSITLTRQHKRTLRCPHVTFPSTTPELIDAFKGLCGGVVCSKHVTSATHRPSWVVTIRHDNALRVLAAIRPYLRHPEKLHRADLLLSRYKAVTPRNGKYSQKLAADKAEFELLFYHPPQPSNQLRTSL